MNAPPKLSATEIKSLKGSAFGQELTLDELEHLLAHAEKKQFPAGSFIYHQGHVASGFYIIISGKADIFTRTIGDKIAKIITRSRGEFVGELCLIDKFPCATFAIAKNDMNCLFISAVYIELLQLYCPETKHKLLKAISIQLCQRIKNMHDKVNQFISNAEMIPVSLFGRVLHSLNHPQDIVFAKNSLDKAQLLKKNIFKRFSESEIKELLAHSSFLSASKNCILIHEKENKPCCYIVLNGAVQSSIMQNNKFAKLSVIGPNLLFASVGCVDRKSTFTISFVTCEAATLLKLSETELAYLQKHKPELWYKIFELICESVVALSQSIDKLDVRLHIELYNR